MEWIQQTIEIEELKEYDKNPRSLSEKEAEHLEKSIEKFGQCEPIVINKDYTIIGGHQRVRVLRGMGFKKVIVYIPTEMLDEKEVEELNIRLNRNNGSWDFDVLANSWDIIDLLDWGFEENELGLGQEEEKKKPKTFSINIKLKCMEDAINLENSIQHLIDGYEGATYKVKLG